MGFLKPKPPKPPKAIERKVVVDAADDIARAVERERRRRKAAYGLEDVMPDEAEMRSGLLGNVRPASANVRSLRRRLLGA